MTCKTCQFNDNGYCQKFDNEMTGEILTCTEYIEKMPNKWREELKKLLKFCTPRHCHRSVLDIRDVKAFISLTLTKAFKEVEKGLPKKKDGIHWLDNLKNDYDYEKIGYNQCLAEVKESIKKTKEKFL